MKRRITLLVLSVLVASPAVAADTVFVAQGKAANVRMQGGPWQTEGGALVCSGKGRVLLGGPRIGPGDFTVLAKLQIDKLRGSAASVVVNGNHLGFEGQQREMFSEGPQFGRRNLGKPVVQSGKPFSLTVCRRGDQLHIHINGRSVFTSRFDHRSPVDIGLRPWRSTMRVVRFVATGRFQTAPRPLPDTTLFQPGKEGYRRYRIPAIVQSKAGTLLAFCEGRTGGDSGPIDLVLKRSTDNGKTWGKLQVVWDDGDNTCGNPCPVVDRQTGIIWLLMTWNLGTDHERQIMAGKSKDVRHVYVTHSSDDGVTWSKPKKISKTTRKKHWRWYATGPGNGIQLTRGKHKGRLLIPANHSDHDSGGHPYRSHVFYSDDHGKTWKLGGVHTDRTNESVVVERGDGSVLQAMRSYHGKNRRAMSVSQDGGQSWGQVYLDQALDTPVCQANMIRYSFADDKVRGSKSRILFASPAGRSRSRMTVWMSCDEGKTWPIRKLIHPGGSAYSNLIVLPQGRIGLMYEKDGYRSISFTTFDLDYLKSK